MFSSAGRGNSKAAWTGADQSSRSADRVFLRGFEYILARMRLETSSQFGFLRGQIFVPGHASGEQPLHPATVLRPV
jgi:hypothetical protein